jgi:hypothetical protein
MSLVVIRVLVYKNDLWRSVDWFGVVTGRHLTSLDTWKGRFVTGIIKSYDMDEDKTRKRMKY